MDSVGIRIGIEGASKAEDELRRLSKGIDNVGMSANQTAFAMRMIPAQMTDIITGLATGQAPLTVLLQQGGQLKDMFGGVGAAARGVTSYVLGLVNPFSVAAAAAGTLAYAYSKGSAESQAYATAMRATNNIIGTTTGQLDAMATAISKGAVYTRGAAAEALSQIAASGAVAGSSLQRLTETALDMEHYGGQSIAKTAERFAELEKDPSKAILKLNESMHFLTLSTYEQITALEDQGKKQDAAAIAQKAYADALKPTIDAARSNLGLLETSWKGVGDAAKWAWDKMLDIGRQETGEQRLAAARAELAKLQSPDMHWGFGIGLGDRQAIIAQTQATVAYLERTIEAGKQSAAAARNFQQAQEAGITATTALTKVQDLGLTKQQQLTKAIRDYWINIDRVRAADPNSALLDPQKIAAGEKALRDQYKHIDDATKLANAGLKAYGDIMAKNSGFEAGFTETILSLVAARDKGKISTNEYAAAVNQLMAMQPGAVALEKASAAALLESAKAAEANYQARQKSLDSLTDQAKKLEEENSSFGLNASALTQLTAQRELDQAAILQGIAIKKLDRDLDYESYDATMRLVTAMRAHAANTLAKPALDAAKEAEAEWKKTTEQIGQSLTDQLMNGGRSAADYLKNLFRTLVLRPVIMAGVGSLTSGMASAASLGGSGSGGNMLGVAGNLASMYNMATAGMDAIGNLGATTIANGVGALGGDALGTLAALKGAGSANMAALGTAANYLGAAGMGIFVGGLISGGKSAIGNNSNTAVVAGTAIGALVAGPIGAFVGGTIGGIVNAAFGHGATELSGSGTRGTFSGTSFTGSNYANYHQDGGWFSSDNNWTDTTALTAEQQASYNASFAATKASMTGMAIALGLATEKITDYTKTVDIAAGTTTEQLTAIFTGMADDMANAAAPGISTFAKIGETASATLSRLGGAITTANAWLSMLRNRLFDVSMSGADAASALADAFGSLDKLAESSKAYYETYYTEAERTQKSTEDLAKAMALVNVALPKTKDQFRAIVSGLDLTTESGRNAYAVLLQLAPEFATAMDSIDKAAVDAANSLIKKFTGSAGVVSAMNSAALNIDDFTGSTTTLTDELTSINTVMGDASSAVIEFRKGTVTLGEKLSDSQISAVLLADQVALLRDSADGARIDFEGLGAALDGVNTETFVVTITKVFESLASRISGVLGDINTERIAVRDAALQIVNPTVMSKEAISRAIAGINTGLPSNAGVVNANLALASADAASEQSNSYWSQRMASANQSLADAQSYSAGLATKYTGLSADFIELQKQFGNIFANIKANDGQVRNGLQYDSKTNRISDYTSTYYTWGDWGWSDLAGYNAAASKSSVYRELWAGNDYLIAAENSIKRWQTYVEDVANQAASAAQANATSVSSAQETAKKAALDYAAALQSFAIDASKSVTKLTKLREETVKYYEQQQQLAELMSTSAGSLRKTISDYNYSQLSPDQQLAVLQGQFSSAYSLAQATQGDGQTLAGYGDKLNSLLGPLIDKLNETNKTSLIANYLAQAESVATLIDAAMPVNYQQDSLDLLGSIDATLAALDESSRSAEQIIADAVNAGSDRTAAGLRAVGEAISGKTLPAFATGGYHAGGARLVGEYGPEVEVTGPSTIYTLSQWRAMSANRGASNTARLEALVERQAQQLEAMSYELRAIAAATGRTAKTLERVTPDGNSLQTSVAA